MNFEPLGKCPGLDGVPCGARIDTRQLRLCGTCHREESRRRRAAGERPLPQMLDWKDRRPRKPNGPTPRGGKGQGKRRKQDKPGKVGQPRIVQGRRR
jgi:hypothetical protein